MFLVFSSSNRGGLVVEHWTPNLQVSGSNPGDNFLQGTQKSEFCCLFQSSIPRIQDLNSGRSHIDYQNSEFRTENSDFSWGYHKWDHTWYHRYHVNSRMNSIWNQLFFRVLRLCSMVFYCAWNEESRVAMRVNASTQRPGFIPKTANFQ